MWGYERRIVVMSHKQKMLLAGLAIFGVIQFIQAPHNESKESLPVDFIKMFYVSDSTQQILKRACFDCHSNNTDYPWYSNIQPMGWLMTNHIKKGKEALNFSEFGNYKSRKQLSKLTGIVNSIKDESMPLSSYEWMHKNARLSHAEKTLIINLINKITDSLSTSN